MERRLAAGGLWSGGLRPERGPLPQVADLAIHVEGLAHAFGATVAVAGLDLRVERGTIYGLVGPDGAGKTTTLRLLAGALPLKSGRAAMAGFDVVAQEHQAKQRIGYVSQRFSLYGDLTVSENLRFFAELHGVSRSQSVQHEAELIAFTGLAQFRDRLARHLSGGMRQKLALATALIHSPEVLLLDEPTTGVDPVSRREFWRILSRLPARGVTIVYATPYMDEAERCNRILFLVKGKALAEGTADDLRALVQGEVLEVLVPTPHLLVRQLAGLPEVADAQAFGDKVHVRVTDAAARAAVEGRLAALDPSAAPPQTIAPSMEDVFMYLTRAWR
ncbi:MAG: ABC transporter ATP-binding protein [Chloroflexota bacterium]